MTPLLSWALLITLGVAGAVFAVTFARWLEAAEDRRWFEDVERWRRMTEELDLTNYDEQESE